MGSANRVYTKVKDKSLITELMKHRRMSVRQLAALVGCNHQTIQNLRTGPRNTVNPEIAERVAYHLDQPYKLLFEVQVSTVSRDYARRNAA